MTTLSYQEKFLSPHFDAHCCILMLHILDSKQKSRKNYKFEDIA